MLPLGPCRRKSPFIRGRLTTSLPASSSATCERGYPFFIRDWIQTVILEPTARLVLWRPSLFYQGRVHVLLRLSSGYRFRLTCGRGHPFFVRDHLQCNNGAKLMRKVRMKPSLFAQGIGWIYCLPGSGSQKRSSPFRKGRLVLDTGHSRSDDATAAFIPF